jgi:hypothetical protein
MGIVAGDFPLCGHDRLLRLLSLARQ